MKTGVAWYVGCPASGKTTLARSHAIQAQHENGYPVLVIDTERVAQLSGFARVSRVDQARELVWTQRRSCAFFPDSADDVERLLRCALKPGRVNLLVDEAHVWLSSRSNSQATLLRLMRAHRHSRVRLFLTTQHLSGDVPQVALACAPELYVFKCTAPATLKRLEQEFGLDSARVRNLAQLAFLRVFEGFET